MHVLARGDLLQRLRLASGLVLFTFAATHFLNHALGLVSLDAMQAMQAWRKVATRSWIGSGALLAAFLIHILLALYKVSRRLTWKLPLWEGAQIVTGLCIPLFLITHVVYNRGAATLAGTDDTYAYELGNIWPGLAWEHAALLLVVWVHGCIGMHYWLSLASWYGRECHSTASGERYNPESMTAAHRTLPFGTMVRVTNLSSKCSTVVRINNRGPFSKGRIIDVSQAAARELKMVSSGVARVSIEVL